jgi:beta-mannosidase
MLEKTFLHSNWEFAEKSWPGGKVATVETGWLPAQVPGHVHLDLVANGIIADPFERMNELGCQWVDRTDWRYRTSFDWSPKDGCPNRVLRFDGLDTVCSIFLNGELVAEHDNMFVPLEVDVSNKLNEGSNELQIHFQSAARVGEERRAEYFTREGINPEVFNFTERAFVRKAQYMFGWDWGPRLVSCGIWKPVCLIEYASRITDVWFRYDPSTDMGRVEVEVEGEGVVQHRIFGYAVASGTSTEIGPLNGGSSALILETALLPEARNVEEVGDYDGADLFDGAVDTKLTRVSCSSTKLVREPDEWGESFEFTVDGERLWARGANWIPDHSFPSVIDKARLRDRLEKAKDMGMNMLRVWGGGLYESDDFYDLCDELGILVWQDFPFGCSYYPDDAHWQEIIRTEAEVNIKRLRNHPCMALWCGNNENEEMFVNAWGGKENNPPRYYGEHLYNQVLPDAVRRLDPGRAYIATSPIGQPPEGTAVIDQKRRGPNSDGYGDQHNWDAWHGRGDWRYYSDSQGRFSSEYGFASSCGTSVWAKILAPEDWNPHSPVVQWHDRTAKGHEIFHELVKLHYPEPVTLEDWVYYSQLNQRDALRHGLEHYRRSVFSRGSLIWQLNDCWPVQSWSILDSDGNYKALAYELRRLHSDLLLSIERKNEMVSIWAVNHGPPSELGWDDEVVVSATDLRDGSILKEWSASFVVLPDQPRKVLELDLTGLSTPDTILFARSSSGGETWQLLDEPKNSRFAEPRPILISTANEGILHVRFETPVVDLMLTSEGDPTAFLDNFITASDGDVFLLSENLPAQIEARSLSGFHPVQVTRSPI